MGILDKFKKPAVKGEGRQPKDQKAAAPAKDKKPAKEAKEAKPEDKKAEQKPADKPKKEKKAKKVSKGNLAKEMGGNSARVLLAPVLTEKSSRMEAEGKYSFFIAPKATKVEVADAIRDLYGVKPEGVRIMNIAGKKVRIGRNRGQRKDRRKAIVSLQKGDAISLTE